MSKQTTRILNFSNPSIFTYERADIKLVYNQSAVSSAKVDGIWKFKIIVDLLNSHMSRQIYKFLA